MRNLIMAVAAMAVGLACAEKFEPPPSEDVPAAKKNVAPKAPAPPPPAAEPEPEPEPTTPEEIVLARKKAQLENRAEDAVKYCALEGVDKMGEQSLLGCVLSACRVKDQEKSSAWGKMLSGALKKEAIKVCHASGVGL